MLWEGWGRCYARVWKGVDGCRMLRVEFSLMEMSVSVCRIMGKSFGWVCEWSECGLCCVVWCGCIWCRCVGGDGYGQ